MTFAKQEEPARRDCGVVLVAAGSGVRMGGAEKGPKQFRLLGGRALFLWSLEFFARQPSVCDIVIVTAAEYMDSVQQLSAEVVADTSVKCVPGGRRRQDSVAAGLQALDPDCELAAVHDAARPFPPPTFEEAVALARAEGGAIYAIPVTDSVKRVVGRTIVESIPRHELWAAQTPQICRIGFLIEALEKCNNHGTDVTDEAAAMEFAGHHMQIMDGSRDNIKLTVAQDFVQAEIIAAGRATK